MVSFPDDECIQIKMYEDEYNKNPNSEEKCYLLSNPDHFVQFIMGKTGEKRLINFRYNNEYQVWKSDGNDTHERVRPKDCSKN